MLKVVSIERVQGEATWFRFANSVRSIIERGARSLPPNLRALFNGIVLGDDRNQTLATGSLFRRSGLSHITAVSGQNVAFVMAVFRPLLHRLRLSQRWLATAVIIVLFATMVRFEPSVLRATAMVAVSVTATTFGRPLSPLRALSLVAIGLIFLDPLLVYSLGFQLSVTACLGIALLTKPIARVLVGPSWLCEALAVTIAAQVGTAPFLFKFSGGVPVVSLVANVVALPLASFVMMWGLAGGLLAGLSPVWMAALIHIPTRVALEIVNAIATVGARLSLGRFGVPHIAALAMMAVVVAIVGSPRRRINTRGDHLRFQLLRIVCATILLLPTLKICAWGQPDIHDSSLDGMRVDRNSSRTIVVVYKTLTPNRAVRTLERLGVYRVDELVVTKNSSSFATVAVEVRNCFGPTHVVAPRGQFLNFDWVTYV